jgi:hypothetical protein
LIVRTFCPLQRIGPTGTMLFVSLPSGTRFRGVQHRDDEEARDTAADESGEP